ncbi:MAG: peptide chain release factor N(5)-glutamine methyltransferase [Chthonomonas sp.]|nr:peptide chain release factor N(5)-glutamine methyltransferase [Chthonomonas sp.]
MTVGEWVRHATEQLKDAGIATPQLEAQLLAAHALDRDRAWVLAHSHDDAFNEEQLSSCLMHRLSRFPLAYITGWREFYGREFSVDTSVLIPRQETETLVQAALEVLPHGAHVLDLGTGSGCVAITLKLERPDLDIVACDISDEALAIAERNAERLCADLDFVWSDGFGTFEDERFDAIITNPPYVEADADLEPEVSEWEPAHALFAGPDGLSFYRRLAKEVPKQLTKDGWFLAELGDGQSAAVEEMFEGRTMRLWRDLGGAARVLGVRFE